MKIIGAASLLAASLPRVEAATATANIGVSLDIEAECQVVTAGDVEFGTHGVLTAPLAASATLDVRCTATTPYTIGLGAGAGTGATIAARLLGDTIQYSLYSDNLHASVWGDASPDILSAIGSGAVQSFTVYGLVPAQATPAPTNYSDTVLVTVSY